MEFIQKDACASLPRQIFRQKVAQALFIKACYSRETDSEGKLMLDYNLTQGSMMYVRCLQFILSLFASISAILRRSCRQLVYSLVLSILILVNLIGNYRPPAASLPHQTILPNPQVSYTLQQFLQQLTPVHLATTPPLPSSDTQISWQGLPQSPATSTNSPSSEPPTMKAVSASLPASVFFMPSTGARPAVSALHLSAFDSQGIRMEVLIPAGALDISHATITNGSAPTGPLTIALKQISGHFAGTTTELGVFQIQVTDARGRVLHGLRLRAPITLVYHYHAGELSALNLAPDRLILAWSDLLSSARAAHQSNSGLVLQLHNNPTAQTLTTQSSVLDSGSFALSSSTPEDQHPPKPLLATVAGNTGQLSFNYPLSVAPGPPGITPQLQVSYSSGDPNGRTSIYSPANNVGDGWSLSLGSISSEKYPDGTTWYSISGVDGISDRLIPDSSGNNFETEHLSYLKITKVTSPINQPCFHVWDTSGDYYEFGCTSDSLQYYVLNGNRRNYQWDLNKFAPANEGPGTNGRVMTVTYVQEKPDSNTVRDSAIKQIVYTGGSQSTVAGTIDFFYKGPTADSPWVTAYGQNEGGCNPPNNLNTTERCDDPLDRSGGLTNPLIMSTLSLQTVKTYVGDDSSASHLYYSYSFSHKDSPFYACTDPTTGSDAYCAGEHLLTGITPTVYQNGTGHTLPGITFTYSSNALQNTYTDTTQKVSGNNFHVATKWKYLTGYMDLSNGVGETITYGTAYNNSNGTPHASDGDNRYDPLFCDTHASLCQGNSFAPMDQKMWTQQVVTSITSSGTDSSSSSLAPAKTTYSYLLARTNGTCAADSVGLTDCVGDGWIPDGNSDWKDYYHGEFHGFSNVWITSPSGDVTVQKYASTWGWDTPESDPRNYLSGQMTEEDIYQGAVHDEDLLQRTVTTYGGQNGTASSCSTTFNSAPYQACEVVPLSTKTTFYELTGTANTNAPWVQNSYTYDDYSTSSGLISGKFHNLTQEVITSSNAPTRTINTTYAITNTTVNGTVYYNVHHPIHTEIVDNNGHTWDCQDTTYDEGVASGVPQPAAGWPTTVKTYTSCGNSSTAITTYTGYDNNGDAVATVDGVGAANPSLYSNAGCTLATAPQFMSAAWTNTHYTTCSVYQSTSGLKTDTWNALGQHTGTTYDATQGLLPVQTTDANGQSTTTAYSYANGDSTVQTTSPGETAGYTTQSTIKSTCTASSTLPCVEVDTNTSLYSSAVTRTFYDSLGRQVETLTPGPDSSHTIVTFTVYNDQAHSVFQSLPFVVASRSTWLDPNGATDDTGATPGGTSTTMDALGRTLTTTDALGNVSRVIYGLGTVNGDPNTYQVATSIDANLHVQATYTDALNTDKDASPDGKDTPANEKTPRVRYVLSYSGLYGGTLTANSETATQYNPFNKPTSVTVTDLAPQPGQTITSVTTTAQYDDMGRLIVLNDPDRGTHTYTYDADGKVLTDVSGSRTIGTSYDLLERARCVQDTAPTTDGSGNCASGSHPLIQTTYDTTTLGTQGSTDFPVGQETQSIATTYYPDGSSSTVTEQFQHDARGQVTAQTLQVSVPASWNVTTALPTYQLTQAYNDANQQTTTQTTIGGQPGYTFTQVYDSTTGQLTGLSNNSIGTANLATLSYNAQAQISDINFLTSAGTPLADLHFTYDGDLRPTGSSTTWQSGSGASGTIFSDALAYDAVGNVISRVTNQGAVGGQSNSGGSETQNFCYDEQNRLVWAGNSGTQPAAGNGTCGSATLSNTLGGNAYSASYVYTNLGQLWQAPLNGVQATQQYLYCDSSHPHQLSGLYPLGTTCSNLNNASYSAGYDAFGNLTTRSYNGSTATLSYDALDWLSEWNAGSNSQDWYAYDATGQRVLQRSTSGSTTMTVYAFGLEEHLYDGSGNHLSDTFYYSLSNGSNSQSNNGQSDASNASTNYAQNRRLLGALTSSGTQFYLTDTLGSVVSTFSNTAGSAAILGNQVYDPYGTQGYNAGTMATAKGFTGQYADPTGLDYYNARYYDPVTGRFLSADVKQDNLHGFDPYAYVQGNPETKNDPTGQDGCGFNIECRLQQVAGDIATKILSRAAFIQNIIDAISFDHASNVISQLITILGFGAGAKLLGVGGALAITIAAYVNWFATVRVLSLYHTALLNLAADFQSMVQFTPIVTVDSLPSLYQHEIDQMQWYEQEAYWEANAWSVTVAPSAGLVLCVMNVIDWMNTQDIQEILNI
jgi:RHS repeat-associated protein